MRLLKGLVIYNLRKKYKLLNVRKEAEFESRSNNSHIIKKIIKLILGFNEHDFKGAFLTHKHNISLSLMMTHTSTSSLFNKITDIGVLELMRWYFPKSWLEVNVVNYLLNFKSLGLETAILHDFIPDIMDEELKILKRDEFFNWRFFVKHWDFQFSRWKKAVTLQTMLWKMQNYRKINKEPFFLKILDWYYREAMGIRPGQVRQIWTNWRTNNLRYWDRSVGSWKMLFDMRLNSLLKNFGVISNSLLIKTLLNYSFILINGRQVFSENKILYIGEILQLNNLKKDVEGGLLECFGTIYQRVSSHLKLEVAPYLYNDVTLNAFSLLRWPYEYEFIRKDVSRWNNRWFNKEMNKQSLRATNYKEPPAKKVIYSRLATKAKVIARLARESNLA